MPHPLRLAPVLALIFVMGAGAPPAAADNVDLALVLAVDVSRSIDDAEYDLQRKGYAAALSDPRVVKAITAGDNGRIALCYFEWSGELSQQVVVDWTVIHDAASAGQFAAQLVEAARPFANRTSLGVAIQYAVGLLGRNPHRATRQVIDVSGDGTNTNGVEPSTMRDAAVAQGVTINGLVINNPNEMPWIPWHTHPPGGLDNYYRQNVAGGPGAFVMQAENFESFSTAIIDKLVREIARNGQSETAAAAATGRVPETKYLIGNAFTGAAQPRM
jgi:hypothetical protein